MNKIYLLSNITGVCGWKNISHRGKSILGSQVCFENSSMGAVLPAASIKETWTKAEELCFWVNLRSVLKGSYHPVYEYFNIYCILVLHSQSTKREKSIKITIEIAMLCSLSIGLSVFPLILEKLSILSSHYLNKAERERLMLSPSAETICSLNASLTYIWTSSPVTRDWNNY